MENIIFEDILAELTRKIIFDYILNNLLKIITCLFNQLIIITKLIRWKGFNIAIN